jgi:hypothetical protein
MTAEPDELQPTALLYGERYYCTQTVPAGSLKWAFKNFPQDPSDPKNRVSYLFGDLLFAHKDDYIQFRLTWS